jgi:hypothetical protein
MKTALAEANVYLMSPFCANNSPLRDFTSFCWLCNWSSLTYWELNGNKFTFFPFSIKRIGVLSSIVGHILIKLSWTTQQQMASWHQRNVTQNLVMIGFNGKRYTDLLCHSNLPILI